MCKYPLALLLSFVVAVAGYSQVVADTVMLPQDSSIEDAMDRTSLFFAQAEKVAAPEKVVLLMKTKKTTTLKKFITLLNGGLQDVPQYAVHAIDDLDGDTKKELLVWNYTGGAHCCDEIYIFKNIGVNKYQQVAKMFGGHTIINDKKEFEYGLFENFGYFFTCFACGYSDTTDAGPIDMSTFTLRYSKGKLAAVPGTIELRNIINDNLGKLGEQPYEKLADAASFDNGLRKEFAFNLGVYYYSFGKNLIETQKLFNKYYKFPDAKKVWTAFLKQLQYMKLDNDF
jgi:hypothetical protein